MRETDPLSLDRAGHEALQPRVGEFPLPVAKDWDELVARADLAAEVMDRHLDFESRLQGRDMRPVTLCPEQKVSMVTDLSAV